VRVTAFEVDHGDKIKPAFGYRIDYKGCAAVISGDTRSSENVVRHATGADVLIHEVGAVRPELLKDPQVQRVMAHHTSPQEVGTILSRARPKLGVYTHLVLLGRPNVPPLSAEELVAQARQTYDGPLEVGEDLMRIDIGDRHVTVHRLGKGR
jgi:ribonuclease Z